jgi:hypothetical protein
MSELTVERKPTEIQKVLPVEIVAHVARRPR